MGFNLNRRNFLTALAGGTVGLGVGASFDANTKSLPKSGHPTENKSVFDASTLPDGLLYTSGYDSEAYPPDYIAYQCVLSEINIKTGEHRTMRIPILDGHSVTVLPERKQLLVVGRYGNKSALVEQDFSGYRLLKTPSDLVFSGHASYWASRGHTLITGHDETSRQAYILDYDADFHLVRKIPVGEGHNPHEMVFLDDSRIVISVGDYNSDNAGFSIFDLDKESVESFTPITSRAPANHLALRKDNRVFGAVRHNLKAAATSSEARQEWGATGIASDDTINWPLEELELRRGAVEFPSPLVAFDPEKGAAECIMSDINDMRWPQTVMCQEQTQRVFGAYVYSHKLTVIEPDGSHQNIDAANFNIREPIGLCDISGTSYMAMIGMNHGVSIIDATTMELVQHWPHRLFHASHVTWHAQA